MQRGHKMSSPGNSSQDLPRSGSSFAKEVIRRSGTDFNQCYHCQSCACGCPFSEAMDYLPNQVIRLVQIGCKAQALQCSSIWICVGCNTCSIQCPNGVDISAVTHTLSQMAIEEDVTIAEPDILNFHQQVLNSIERHGRTHKTEIMLRYKLKKRDWFSDMGVGMKMFAKGKLGIFPHRVKQLQDIKDMFKKNGEGRAE